MNSKKPPLVLDTSALFAMQDLPQEEVYATPGVIKELERHGDKRADLWGELLKVWDPSAASLKKVKEAASMSGDSTRVSPTDIEVIALALDLDAIIITDDYSIQNLAGYMGIPYRPAGFKGITRIIKWKWRCAGCRRVFDKEVTECPVCGSELRSFRLKGD